MTIMTEDQRIDNTIQKKFEYFFKRFGVNRILRNVGATKQKGVSAYLLFNSLLGLATNPFPIGYRQLPRFRAMIIIQNPLSLLESFFVVTDFG